MNYEEKYKKAVQQIRDLLERSKENGWKQIFAFEKDFEQIFPELVSEDERIQKWCVAHFKTSVLVTNNAEYKEYLNNKVIPWLEKQGEKKPFDYENATIKQKDFAPMQEPKFKVKYAGSEYNVFDIKDIDGVTLYGIEDEPNHIDYVNAESCEIIGDCAINVEQEEKFSDNVKPKFSVDEWVAADTSFDRSPLHIMSVSDPWYRVEGIEGNSGMPKIKYIDNSYHHYTIRDAKDGDVLACNEEILLFKSYSVQGRISLYCWYNGQTNNFHSKEVSDKLLTTRNKICPATKEQRELFFAKMKKAGYKWDGHSKRMLRDDIGL